MISFKESIQSSNKSVSKYIYEDDTALVETVIYKYPDYQTRTTICISVQSGCPVGCVFCGTGKKFLRNLEVEEIVYQVAETFHREKIVASSVEKLQIMFMSMGEPFLNFDNVCEAIQQLSIRYPNAELLISTVGIIYHPTYFIILSKKIPQIGLQFSIHHYNDTERNKLIPYFKKMTLEEIAYFGKKFFIETGRHPFCNYIVTEDNNTGYEKLFELFPPDVFNFTFSVLCSLNESIKSAFINNKDKVQTLHDDFLSHGYNVRLFDPAGQDDIGGGCGQLWYFQKKIREVEDKQ